MMQTGKESFVVRETPATLEETTMAAAGEVSGKTVKKEETFEGAQLGRAGARGKNGGGGRYVGGRTSNRGFSGTRSA